MKLARSSNRSRWSTYWKYSLLKISTTATSSTARSSRLAVLVRVMERHPDPAQFREDDRIEPLVARLEAWRTGTAAGASRTGPRSKGSRRASRPTAAPGAGRQAHPAEPRGSEVAAAVSTKDVRQITTSRDTLKILFNTWDAAPDSEKGKKALADAKEIFRKLRPSNQLDGKAVFDALDEEIRQAKPGSEQLTKINAVFSALSASMPKADVKSLIEGLKSTDTDTRRQSRQALANVNDEGNESDCSKSY